MIILIKFLDITTNVEIECEWSYANPTRLLPYSIYAKLLNNILFHLAIYDCISKLSVVFNHDSRNFITLLRTW